MNSQSIFSPSLQTLFEVSCVQCKQWHSKCDRILPCCSQCKKRGISCEYKAKKRRRSPIDSNSESPSNTSNSPSSATSITSPSSFKYIRTEPSSSQQQQQQDIILDTSLKQSSSRLHLPENYSIINSNLIQHLLSEHCTVSFPLIHLLKTQLLANVSSAQKKEEIKDRIGLAFVFSCQGMACIRLKMIDQAKQFFQTSMHILHFSSTPLAISSGTGGGMEFWNIMDNQNQLMEQHPLLASVLIQWIGLALLDKVLIRRVSVLYSYLQIYIQYQKKQLLSQKNLLQQRLQQQQQQQSSSSSSSTSSSNSQTTQQSTTTTTNVLGLKKEQIIVQLSILEHMCKHIRYAMLFSDDDLYYSTPILDFMKLYWEGFSYNTVFSSQTARKYFVPESETAILPSILQHIHRLIDLLQQYQITNSSQWIAIAMQFESVCTLFETYWAQGKNLRQEDAFLGSLLSLRGLRMRFLHEQLLFEQQQTSSSMIPMLQELVVTAATQYVTLVSQSNPLQMVRGWYCVKRFTSEATLIFLEEKTVPIDTLKVNLQVLELVGKEWGYSDEAFDMLIQQVSQKIQDKLQQQASTAVQTTEESVTQQVGNGDHINWDEMDLFFKQWE